jgi:hypothetical protein
MPVLLVGAMYAVTIALLSGKTVVRAGSRLLLALLDLISRYVSKVPAVLVRHMLQLPLDVPYAALYVATTTVRGVIRTILGTKRLSDRARHKLLAALESQKPAVLNALVSPAAPLPMPSQADLPRVAAALRPIAAHMSDRPTSSPRKSSPGRNRRSPSRNRRSPSRNRRSPGKPSPRTGRRTT